MFSIIYKQHNTKQRPNNLLLEACQDSRLKLGEPFPLNIATKSSSTIRPLADLSRVALTFEENIPTSWRFPRTPLRFE